MEGSQNRHSNSLYSPYFLLSSGLFLQEDQFTGAKAPFGNWRKSCLPLG